MKLKRGVTSIFPLLFLTFGTVCFTQLTSAVIKPIPIGLYWDEECTNSVSSMDFGTLAKGYDKSVTFWLKSYRTDKGRISWASANFNPFADGITGFWERKVGRLDYISNWNKKIKPDELWQVRYTIKVAQDIQVGMYSWDLIVCYTSHKSSLVNCLSVACILNVT